MQRGDTGGNWVLRVLPANLCRSRNVEHAATSHFSAKVCNV